jgi:signal peptidase I
VSAHSGRIELEIARAARERGRRCRFRFTLTGQSMRPALVPGMRVTVEVVPAGELREGDLVCWFRPAAAGGQKVIHRLVRVETDGPRTRFVTRGDAHGFDDPPVDLERVIGRVIDAAPPGACYRIRRALRRAAAAAYRTVGLLVSPLAARAIAGRVSFEVAPAPGGKTAAGADVTSLEAHARIGARRVGGGHLVRRAEWGADVWELSSVETSRWLRNLGIATGICRSLLHEGEALGVPRVCLLVSPGSRPAIHLYRKLGFRRSADRALERRLTATDPADRRRVLMEVASQSR